MFAPTVNCSLPVTLDGSRLAGDTLQVGSKWQIWIANAASLQVAETVRANKVHDRKHHRQTARARMSMPGL